MQSQFSSLHSLRQRIRSATHDDEATCVESLLAESTLTSSQREHIVELGSELVEHCRKQSDSAGTLDAFMQEFSLSSKEGVALMCLAESLLRVPDAETVDALIAEKIRSGNWGKHLGQSDSLFVNASTWGLMLTGRVVQLDNDMTRRPQSWFKAFASRVSEPVVRLAVTQAMKIMGQQYVLGRTINEAIKRGAKENVPGTRFSFDMLGEGARTMAQAKAYFEAYKTAITSIGQSEHAGNVYEANGISVKLSALHPRYERVQEDRVFAELLPSVRELALEAKKYGLGFSIDAEEADRLDISLDLFECLAKDKELAGWNGLGFVLQAYSKRAPIVIDWLTGLAEITQRRFMVRLVKGAYWDHEIKHAQEEGFDDYPVYTRKENTDLSYQICAQKLLAKQDFIYPQFASHNAHTVALIKVLGEGKRYEFQRLHGMGDLLYKQMHHMQPNLPVRVYAPVGAHRDLLPYLVRRLLENGANSSFVNRFLDKALPVDQVICDVQQAVEGRASRRHPHIPLPIDILRGAGDERHNAQGIDFSNSDTLQRLLDTMASFHDRTWSVGPIIGGVETFTDGAAHYSPAAADQLVALVEEATAEQTDRALSLAEAAHPGWDSLGGQARADILDRAAESLESNLYHFIGLIAFEAGRTLNDGLAEVREAIDFLRYYAAQARKNFQVRENMISPAGHAIEHRLGGLGVFVCISPWNFPLAIFVGQVAAALAAGNSVVAKPADQTPAVAAEAVKLLHRAGVPVDVLNFLPGAGQRLGALMTGDCRVKGVAFTGSTATARTVQKALLSREFTDRPPELAAFIAETGGQNTMIVDSSALPEQVVDDVIRSAFLSAGQRCSALRVLYLQEDVADNILAMLKGAMDEITLGHPWQANTDCGPVIDNTAKQRLQAHIDWVKNEAQILKACEVPKALEGGCFFPPHLIELQSIRQLTGEVFGPILHVIRYKKSDIQNVLNDINATGFGLTLGIHSRVEGFAREIIARTHVGNNYINRNMVGAVVGVQPFGGQGLSGTGPKAGGPHYLFRFAQEHLVALEPAIVDQIDQGAVSGHQDMETVVDEAFFAAIGHAQPMWNGLGGEQRAIILKKAADGFFQTQPGLGASVAAMRFYADQSAEFFGQATVLPGPTGEANTLSLNGRGVVACCFQQNALPLDIVMTATMALAAGNAVVLNPTKDNAGFALDVRNNLLAAGVPNAVLQVVVGEDVCQQLMRSTAVDVLVWNGSEAQAIAMQKQLFEANEAIKPLVRTKEGNGLMLRLFTEKTITNNVVATGGNTFLLNLGDED